jgi:RHS repeat-associated protein
VGAKNYELSNHLGNVLATISDKTIFNTDHYNGIVYSAQLYYPFGWEILTLSYTAKKYRFGFNGKEDDREWHAQDYGFRLYTPREGRFIGVDPITAQYPELTPYQFASNSPIAGVDLDGLEQYIVINSIPTGQNVKSTQVYTIVNINTQQLQNFRASFAIPVISTRTGTMSFPNPMKIPSNGVLELNLIEGNNGNAISSDVRSNLTLDELAIINAGVDKEYNPDEINRIPTLRSLVSGVLTLSVGGNLLSFIQIQPSYNEDLELRLYNGEYSYPVGAATSRGSRPVQGATVLPLDGIGVRPDRNNNFGSFMIGNNDITQNNVINIIQQQTSVIPNVNSININFGNTNTPASIITWANTTFVPALSAATGVGVGNISVTNNQGANFSVTVNSTQQQSTGTQRSIRQTLRP